MGRRRKRSRVVGESRVDRVREIKGTKKIEEVTEGQQHESGVDRAGLGGHGPTVAQKLDAADVVVVPRREQGVGWTGILLG